MFIRINKAHFLKTVAQNRKCFALLNLARNKENENKKSLRHYKTLSIKHLKPCRILQDNETKWRRERERERKKRRKRRRGIEEKGVTLSWENWNYSNGFLSKLKVGFFGGGGILFIYIYFFGSLFKIFFFLHVYMCTHIQHLCHMYI